MAESFQIDYSDEAFADLKTLRVYDQRMILDAIALHLSFEPAKESRSRIKAMAQPFWSHYRLRVDDFRVYYDIDDATRTVSVLRVLEKSGETPQEPP
ncbi:MAG TPA: type II toxin-antitoxin system RelE/ParE family toxin [Pirellulaceae bacterium]|nr:type II toxin-antitoxin system RelE/ParE family toxin [Pirellulaceae bacterium]